MIPSEHNTLQQTVNVNFLLETERKYDVLRNPIETTVNKKTSSREPRTKISLYNSLG